MPARSHLERLGEIARKIADEDFGEFTDTPKAAYCMGCGVQLDREALARIIFEQITKLAMDTVGQQPEESRS